MGAITRPNQSSEDVRRPVTNPVPNGPAPLNSAGPLNGVGPLNGALHSHGAYVAGVNAVPANIVPDTRSGPLAADTQLLLAAQRGDRAGFVSIVERHQGAIYGYLRSRLMEPADAEDLCQEVFLRCYTGKARFDKSALVRPWLIGVARNVLREHIRSVTRRQEIVWTELCLELEAMVEPDERMYDDVLLHLPGCLESLGPSARQALELRYTGKMKLAAIGDRLHRSVGAIKLLMHRSRQALKRCLDVKLAKERS